MSHNTRIVLGITLAGLLALAGVGVAIGSGALDDERPITDEAYERASDAALAAVGGGRVTETEVGDEDSYYEVEVTLADGTQVDVQLDRDFKVIGTSYDSEQDEGASDADDD